jgi:hypothetical protein
MTTGEVRLESDGSPWRPLVHIEDISRVFLAVLEAPRELVHDEAFNVGRPEDNVLVKDIADLVRDTVPGSRISFAEDAGPDLRNYRVDLSKLAGTFPSLDLHWRVRDGIEELVGAYTRHGLTYDDFISARFVRLRRIRELVSAGLVDDMLAARPAQPSRRPAQRLRSNIRAKVCCLAGAPKPGLPGPGRPPGSKNRHRAPRHDVGNTTKRKITLKARRERPS